MKAKYTHYEELHNLEAPNEIVPVIIDLIHPSSVVDVGCGLGTFLKVFKNCGIKKILGIDGSWCDKELLYKNIGSEEFLEKDLEKTIRIDQYFDLVVCLEVAEHLSEKRADSFVADLVSLGNIILFSAAIPLMGGINHINEQWPDYWEKKFIAHGYVKHDILKPYFWNKKNIWWWYKQNMVIYTKKNFQFDTSLRLEYNTLNDVIHPELYASKTQNIKYLTSGRASIYYYLKLLVKSILFRTGLYK
jgi:SAM-dependent methyltransferase